MQVPWKGRVNIIPEADAPRLRERQNHSRGNLGQHRVPQQPLFSRVQGILGTATSAFTYFKSIPLSLQKLRVTSGFQSRLQALTPRLQMSYPWLNLESVRQS